MHPIKQKSDLHGVKYKYFNITTTQVGKGQILVHSGYTNNSTVYPNSVVKLLLFCHEFDTLDSHAKKYLMIESKKYFQNKNIILKKLLKLFLEYVRRKDSNLLLITSQYESTTRVLSTLVHDGFLVSNVSIMNKINMMSRQATDREGEPSQIKSIGIPTCDRPENLSRCLASYVENAKIFNRNVSCIIADDSADKKYIKRNLKNLYEIKDKYGVDIYYFNKNRRKKYADLLANSAGLPLPIIHFGLLGDNESAFTVGANRNALLLQTVGELSVQVDDDTICQFVPKLRKKQTTALSSEMEYEFWFYKNRDRVSNSMVKAPDDFLARHEELLGQNVHTYLQQNGMDINIEHMNSDFLDSLKPPESRIARTHFGLLGDSGMNRYSHLDRLLLKGESFHRLINPAKDYFWKRDTRFIGFGSTRMNIFKGPFCMSTNIGLDHRFMLPPFMPINRNGDGIFGVLLKTCFADLYAGSLPFLLSHAPPKMRTHIKIMQIGVLRPRISDILRWLILNFHLFWPDSGSDEEKIILLGRYLKEVGTMELASFNEFIRQIVHKFLIQKINRLRELVGHSVSAPDYWLKDIAIYIKVLQNSLAQNSVVTPYDIAINNNDDEKNIYFRSLIKKFGELCIYWPQIVDAAVHLKEEGIEVAIKL